MRQITERICDAFVRCRPLKIDNSETDGRSLWLFGNKIAEWRHGELCITNAGYKTKTTKERLNGLPGVRIHQLRGQWYLNDTMWDGGWVQISNNYGNWEVERIDEDDIQEAVEFDTTCEWLAEGKYSRPVYAVFHTNDASELDVAERSIKENGVPVRRMESDTVGKYKPNYFLVVRPQDYETIKTKLQ